MDRRHRGDSAKRNKPVSSGDRSERKEVYPSRRIEHIESIATILILTLKLPEWDILPAFSISLLEKNQDGFFWR
jgi:hypothetical protein